jgi:transposase-like protein
MDESSKSKRVERREFWGEAIRLWVNSGLSVQAFCRREGLATQTFYSWRRELLADDVASGVNPESSSVGNDANNPRRRRKRLAADSVGKSTSAIEFLPVRVIGDDVSQAHALSTGVAAEAAPIEIVGVSPWRVRILAGFAPTTLDAVLTALERRPC